MRRLVILVCAVYALLLCTVDAWAAAAAAAERDALPSLDQLIRQFETAALAPRQRVLIKRRHPVRTYIDVRPDGADAPYREHILRAAEDISREAETPVSIVASSEEALLEIVFAGPVEIAAKLRAAYGATPWNENEAWAPCTFVYTFVRLDYVFINTEHRSAPDVSCVYAMMYQVMGFPDTACHYRPSLLCADDSPVGLTRGDRLLMRALYDPRLIDGMEIDVARPIAHVVLAEVYAEELGGGRKVAAWGETPTLGQIIRQFESIVFLDEGFASYKEARVRKWLTPIRMRIASEPAGVGNRFMSDVLAALAEFSRDSGLSIRVAEPGEHVNFDLLFADRQVYVQSWIDTGDSRRQAEVLAKLPCHGVVERRDRSGPIAYAAVYIGVFVGEPLVRSCILEEIYNALGPMNDACRFRPSIVCEDDSLEALSLGDRLVLKALYHPRISRGDSIKNAMPTAREVLERLYAETIGPR